MMSVFWQDLVTSYRTEDVTDPKSHITSQMEVIKANNVYCHYSQSSKRVPVTEGSTKTVSEQALFCSLSADIKEGDRLVITQRNGNIVNASAGEIFPYTGKLQITVKRDDSL